jgi:glycosyltransferase involved in cell wall biosynthesis
LKVTIITVAFNSEDTIERAVLSVLNQTYTNIEYIIIDGNSNDNSVNILNKYSHKFFKLISENDEGIYDAMNKGLKLATGDIICFLNSDDIYFNENTIIDVVSEFNNNKLDIVFGDVVFFKDDINKITRYYSSKFFNFKMLKYGLMPAHQSIFIKKNIFEKYGNFSVNFKIAGDFDWVARVFKDDFVSYKYVEKIFVKMQVGGISTSGLKSKLKINLETLKSCKINGIDTNYFNLLIKYFYKIFQFKLFCKFK